MIAFSVINVYNKQVTLADSKGRKIVSENVDELLGFILDGQDGFAVTWNVDQLFAPLIRLLSADDRKTIFDGGKIRTSKDTLFIFNSGKSAYIGRKHGLAVRIFHLEQYYPDTEELNNPDDVYAAAEQLLKELAAIGAKPEKLSSAATIFEDKLRAMRLPTWKSIPEPVNQAALNCRGKVWITAYKLGYFEKAYDLDLTAAYPSVLAKLPDLRRGEWGKCTKPPKDAIFGYGKGQVSVSADISPIIYQPQNGDDINPTGTWPDVMLLQDIRFLKEYGCGKFECEGGLWWIPKGPQIYPLDMLMHDLFRQRQTASPLLNRVIKRGMNSMYGLLGQLLPDDEGGIKYGEFVNFVYHTAIEAKVRLKVARFIYDNNLFDNLLSVATDGVMLNQDLELPNNNGMGSWRLDSSGPALIAGSGMLFYGDKRPAQLYLDEALELIKSKPKSREWTKKVMHRRSLKDVVNSDVPFGDKIETETGFRLLLAQEHDRKFENLPANGEELLNNVYESNALEVKDVKSS